MASIEARNIALEAAQHLSGISGSLQAMLCESRLAVIRVAKSYGIDNSVVIDEAERLLKEYLERGHW